MAKVWCAKACYRVVGNVGKVVVQLESLPRPHKFVFLDLDAGFGSVRQVAVNPEHVSAVEPDTPHGAAPLQ